MLRHKGGETASRKCPNCHSKRIWKNGKRNTRTGSIQRFVCRECGYRFGESTVLSTNHFNSSERQICVTLTEGTKNLTKVKTRIENRFAGATTDIKGKIVEYLWYLKKQGYRKSTITSKVNRLERLVRLGANLYEPENVKQIISNDQWKENYKAALVSAYQSFTEMEQIAWKPPIYKPTQKLPFVPHENEIDALIAGCGKKVATSLQLLKETGMRIGEAWNLEWIDVDQENQTVTVTPEKHGTPR